MLARYALLENLPNLIEKQVIMDFIYTERTVKNTALKTFGA